MKEVEVAAVLQKEGRYYTTSSEGDSYSDGGKQSDSIVRGEIKSLELSTEGLVF